MDSTDESYLHAVYEPKNDDTMETYVESFTESLTHPKFSEQGFLEDVQYDDTALEDMLHNAHRVHVYHSQREGLSVGLSSSSVFGKLYAYLVSFTTEAPNRIVPNAGEGNGFEAWRRLHGENDPMSSVRRVAVLQQVQNSPRFQRVEDLGAALEDWLSKKRQCEMFTDRDRRPCQASGDSLVATMFSLMPKSLEV